MLMVGALKCTSPGYDVAGHYNNFITSHRTALAGHNDVLKVHFIREQGIREGRRAYDSFTTGLANAHSSAAQATPAAFCQNVNTLVGLASTAAPGDLEALAETIAERPVGVGESCNLPGTVAGYPESSGYAVTAPSTTAVLSDPNAPQTAVAQTPQTGGLTPVQPQASGNASASAPTEVATAIGPQATSTTPQPSAAEALHAAALAVQAAAAALEASAAGSPAAATAPSTAAAAPSASGTTGAGDTMQNTTLQPEPVIPPQEQ